MWPHWGCVLILQGQLKDALRIYEYVGGINCERKVEKMQARYTFFWYPRFKREFGCTILPFSVCLSAVTYFCQVILATTLFRCLKFSQTLFSMPYGRKYFCTNLMSNIRARVLLYSVPVYFCSTFRKVLFIDTSGFLRY